MNTHTCRSGQTTMEKGYIADYADHNNLRQAEWVEGQPERYTLLGVKLGITTKGHPVRRITVWRCPRCGFLEHYAL